MKMKYKNVLIKTIVLITIILLILFYIYIDAIRVVVNLVFISFVVSYTLKPMRNYIVDKFKLSRKKASITIIVCCIIIFLGIIYFMIPSLLEESKNIGNLLDSLENYILKVAEKFDLDDLEIFQIAYIEVQEKINVVLSNFSVNLFDNLISILENLIGLAIVPVVAYYFLADGDVIYNKLLLIFPTSKRAIIKKINHNVDKVLSRYILSQIILSVIIGVLSFILLITLRIKMPLVLSVLNGIVNIIPYFGPVIGGVPIVFIALTGSITKGIIATIGVVAIQQIEGDFLAPKITGDSTNMHPVVIILLLILGEKIAGVAGMVLCVPIAVIIKVIYDDINYYLF